MPKMPSAMPCSAAGNACSSSAMPSGRAMPPPKPWSARAAISRPRLGDSPHSSEPSDEQAQPAQVDPLDAEAIGQEAGQRRADAQRQHVDADDPLRVVEVAAELLAQRLEGHVDHRGVQDDHEDAEDDGAQHLPLVVGRRLGGRIQAAAPFRRVPPEVMVDFSFYLHASHFPNLLQQYAIIVSAHSFVNRKIAILRLGYTSEVEKPCSHNCVSGNKYGMKRMKSH